MIKEKNLLKISRGLSKYKIKSRENVKLKLFVMSNYTTQFIQDSMKLSALENGVNLDIQASGYNQWEFSILNFENIEKKYNPDFILISLSSLLLIFGKKDLDEN